MIPEKGIDYRFGAKTLHAGCEMLPDGGKDIEYIVIERIEVKEKENVGGRQEENVWIGYFAPNPYTTLPFIINATNRKRIAKMSGTRQINLLKNFPVRLTHEDAKDMQDGGTTWGLRISKLPPKMPPITATTVTVTPVAKTKPKVLDADIEKTKTYLQTHTMAELKEVADVSEEMEKKLLTVDNTKTNG